MIIKTDKQHRKMWLEIAEAYYTSDEEQTEKQYDLSLYGYCKTLDILGLSDLGGIMFRNHAIIRWGEDSQWRLPENNKINRGDLAYLFSTMTVKEFESIVGYKYNGEKIGG